MAVLPAAAFDSLVVAAAEADAADPPGAALQGRAVLDPTEVGPLVELAVVAPERAVRRLTRAGLEPVAANALAAALAVPRTGTEVHATGAGRVATVAWLTDADGRRWRHIGNSHAGSPTLEIEAVTATELADLVTATVGAVTPRASVASPSSAPGRLFADDPVAAPTAARPAGAPPWAR